MLVHNEAACVVYSEQEQKYIISIKQRPFMNVDIGLYDKLTEAHWGP